MFYNSLFFYRAQAHLVEIPSDLECKDCTIRLVRQALEWSKRYLFWSCADVDIVQAGQYAEDCSGHGKALAGRCRCDRLYYGHRCQYQDECINNDDCGFRGRCINVDATTAPRKQCFCQLGYFGPGCSKVLRIAKMSSSSSWFFAFSSSRTPNWGVRKSKKACTPKEKLQRIILCFGECYQIPRKSKWHCVLRALVMQP